MVTGVSGSGKTTLILESLVPALEAADPRREAARPRAAASKPTGIGQVKLIDATPIGINVRSTVATYANVHDELRKVYAKTPDAKAPGLQGRRLLLQHGRACAAPPATAPASISLDVQFLPDVDIPCPDCRGSRYCQGGGPRAPITANRAAPTHAARADGHGRQPARWRPAPT